MANVFRAEYEVRHGGVTELDQLNHLFNEAEVCAEEAVEQPINDNLAKPEIIAQIMTQKFVMGFSLHQQEQVFNSQGVLLSRQTMSNWLLRATEEHLVPVYHRLHEELVKREILHVGVTALRGLHAADEAPLSESYLWQYRTGGDTDRAIVLYEHQAEKHVKYPREIMEGLLKDFYESQPETNAELPWEDLKRSYAYLLEQNTRNPEGFLKGFRGYIHLDDCAGYYNFPNEITRVGSWADIRERFENAARQNPKCRSAEWGAAYCRQLLDLEEQFQSLSPDERHQKRLEQEVPVVKKLMLWARTARAFALEPDLCQILDDVKEQRPYLLNYLKDGRLELCNQASASLKSVSDHLQSADTSRGSAGSTVMFSLIQTAIENGLEPYSYLVRLLKTSSTDLQNPDIVEKLLPWNAIG